MSHFLLNFTRKNAERDRPLSEQAAALLQLQLWGIGESTPLRATMARGDYAVAFVGAPERSFVGWGRLLDGVHKWTNTERPRYGGPFTSGISFDQVGVFGYPIPISSLLPDLDLARTNPGARFFSGVLRITGDDFARIVQAGGEVLPDAPATAPGEIRIPPGASQSAVDLLYRASEQLKRAIQDRMDLTEQDTRAWFIDRYIEALGYTSIGDVRRGSLSESRNYPDYVLYIGSQPKIGIEAKRLGHRLGSEEAAQATRDCSVTGTRWAILTDGRYWKVYETMVPDTTPEQRLIFEVDIAEHEDREDFETRIFPLLALIAKEELETGIGLERRASMEAIRQLLSDPNNESVVSVQEELRRRRNLLLERDEIADLISDLIG
jgi:hypothetical protein